MGNVLQPLWAECPMLSRMIVVGYPLLSISVMLLDSVVSGWLSQNLFLGSIYNLERFKVWTLPIGPFYFPLQSGMQFLTILFEMYMGLAQFPPLEKEMGSTGFLGWLLIMNTLLSLLYVAVMGVLMAIYSGSMRALSYEVSSLHGLWPLIMLAITLTCVANWESSTSFFGMISIPNKWYPIALAGFFFLLSGFNISYGTVAALLVGYSYNYLHLYRLVPSKVRAAKLEQTCCRGGRCSLLGGSWLAASDLAGYDVESGDRRYATIGDISRSGATQNIASQPRSSPGAGGGNLLGGGGGGGGGGGNFQAFSGQGNRLGSEDDHGQEMRTLPSSS